MTNPLTDSAFNEWMDQGPSAPTNGDCVRHDKIDVELLRHLADFMFRAGMDYLRAELAKEEPVFFASPQTLLPTIASRINRFVVTKELQEDWTVPPYLRPSEPIPCPFIETSQEGTSYCRLAAGQNTKEKDHG